MLLMQLEHKSEIKTSQWHILLSYLEPPTPPHPLLPILMELPWTPLTDQLKPSRVTGNLENTFTTIINTSLKWDSQGIPSMSSSICLMGTPSKSSRGAPSISAPSRALESMGTPSTSSSGMPSTYSPKGAPSRSSAGSGCHKHIQRLEKVFIPLGRFLNLLSVTSPKYF